MPVKLNKLKRAAPDGAEGGAPQLSSLKAHCVAVLCSDYIHADHAARQLGAHDAVVVQHDQLPRYIVVSYNNC